MTLPRLSLSLALLAALLGFAAPAAAEAPGRAESGGLRLEDRARIDVPDGLISYFGSAAQDEAKANGRPADVGLALFARTQTADPITLRVVWHPEPFKPVEAAPSLDAARTAINDEIARTRPRIGTAGTAVQFSDWVEEPALNAETHMVRRSYSVETRPESGNGTAFVYRASAYGRSGHYELIVEASADRAMGTAAVYESALRSFQFLPGHTYAEGLKDFRTIPTGMSDTAKIKLTVFLVSLALVILLLVALYWVIVKQRIHERV